MPEPVPRRLYTLLAQRQDAWYDPDLDTVVEGWEFRVRWEHTGAVFTVRVRGTPPTKAAVDTAIKTAGEAVTSYGTLGA